MQEKKSVTSSVQPIFIIKNKEDALLFLSKEKSDHFPEFSSKKYSEKDIENNYFFICKKCKCEFLVIYYSEICISTVMYYDNYNASCDEILMDEALK